MNGFQVMLAKVYSLKVLGEITLSLVGVVGFIFLIVLANPQPAKADQPGPYWSKESTGGALKRYGHGSAVYGNKLWILGGYYDSGGCSGWGCLDDDVWSSSDGKTWVRTTADAPWQARFNLDVRVQSNRIYALAPTNPFAQSGLLTLRWYRTDNGVGWEAITNPNFSPTENEGSYYDPGCDRNFTSSDNGISFQYDFGALGLTWNDLGTNCQNGIPYKGASAPGSPPDGYPYDGSYGGAGVVQYGGVQWILGGNFDTGQSLDLNAQVRHQCLNGGVPQNIWKAALPFGDRSFWLNTGDNIRDRRYAHASIKFNNKMWVIGGIYDNGGAVSIIGDAWASDPDDGSHSHSPVTEQCPGVGGGGASSITKEAPSTITNYGAYKYTITYSFISGSGNGDDYHSVLETLNHANLRYFSDRTHKPRLCDLVYSGGCNDLTDSQVVTQGQDVIFKNLTNFNTVPQTLQNNSIEFYVTFSPPTASFSSACTTPIVNDKVFLYNTIDIPADRSQYIAAIQAPYPTSQVRCFDIGKQFSKDGASYSSTISGVKLEDTIWGRVNYKVYESQFGGSMSWGIFDKPNAILFVDPTYASLDTKITNVDNGQVTTLGQNQVDIQGFNGSKTVLFKQIAVTNAHNYRLDFKLKIACVSAASASNEAYFVNPLNTQSAISPSVFATAEIDIAGSTCLPLDQANQITKTVPTLIQNYALNYGTPSKYTINFTLKSTNADGQASVEEILPDNWLKMYGVTADYCNLTDNQCTTLTPIRGQVAIFGQKILFQRLPVVTNARKDYRIEFNVTFAPPVSEFPYHCTGPLVNNQLRLYDFSITGGQTAAELTGPYPYSNVRCLDLTKGGAGKFGGYKTNDTVPWDIRYKAYTSFASNADGSSVDPGIGASPWAIYDLPQWYVFADPDFNSLEATFYDKDRTPIGPLDPSQVVINGDAGKKTITFQNIAVPNALITERYIRFKLKAISCDLAITSLNNVARFINLAGQARLSGDYYAAVNYFRDGAACTANGRISKIGPAEVVADGSLHVYKYTLDYTVTSPNGQNYSIKETLPNTDFTLVNSPDPRYPKCVAKSGSPNCANQLDGGPMGVSVSGQDVFFTGLPTVTGTPVGGVVEFYLSFTSTVASPCESDVTNTATMRTESFNEIGSDSFSSRVQCPESIGTITKTGPALVEYYGQIKTFRYTIGYTYESPSEQKILIRDRLPNNAYKLATPAPTCTPDPNLPVSPACQFAPGDFYMSGNDIYFRVPTLQNVNIGGTIQFYVSFKPWVSETDDRLDTTKCDNQSVNSATLIDGGAEAVSTTFSSEVECVDIRKYQTTNITNPNPFSGDWVTHYSESAGIAEGMKILFRINYRAAWSGASGPIKWELRDTPQAGKLSFDSTSVRLDAPSGNPGNPYGGSVLAEGSDGDGSHFKINGSQIIFNHNNNLPEGDRQITFFMTVGNLACDTGGTANNEVVGIITARDPYDPVNGSTTNVTTSKYLTRIELDCPFAVIGDVGATDGTMSSELIVNGPSVVTLGSGSPTSSKIRDEVRVLPFFTTPYKSAQGWQEQIRRATNQLKTEFAKTRSLQFDSASGGDPVLDFSTSPLRIFKYDLSTSADKCLLENITLNGPGTLILTDSPVNDPTCKTQSIQIVGGILMRNITVTGGPVAIIVDNDCRNLGTTNGTPIRFSLPFGSTEIQFGSSNNPLALIAPCSVVDLGYPSRNISYHGLIVAGGVANANIQTGEITYEDEVVNSPPPGLFQIIRAVIKEVEP